MTAEGQCQSQNWRLHLDVIRKYTVKDSSSLYFIVFILYYYMSVKHIRVWQQLKPSIIHKNVQSRTEGKQISVSISTKDFFVRFGLIDMPHLGHCVILFSTK